MPLPLAAVDELLAETFEELDPMPMASLPPKKRKALPELRQAGSE